jgi:hypothetical protein
MGLGAWVGLVQPDAMHLDLRPAQELVQAQAGDPSPAAVLQALADQHLHEPAEIAVALDERPVDAM